MTMERTGTTMDVSVVKGKLHDVRKLTSAAAKLRLGNAKRKSEKEKIISKKQQEHLEEKKEAERQLDAISKKEVPEPAPSSNAVATRNNPVSSEDGRIITATRTRPEKRWTLTELLHCLGTFVQHECKGLVSRPTAPEVAMWVRCTDKALQLNGWTINSFLLESHVVFTFMLLQKAFDRFSVRTLTDAKELVLMCLYISYTYNANEISYPLRPFLVKQDRVTFWAKCTELSLSASHEMLMLNKERTYYRQKLSQLRSMVNRSNC